MWQVIRAGNGVLLNLEKKRSYVNSFHILDPQWGYVTIKMSGHPPFAAQVILNGHEYVACQARAAGIPFTKEGNCFTAAADPAGLAQVADTLSQPAAIGRLSQVCDRWIYSACLCFGAFRDDRPPGSCAAAAAWTSSPSPSPPCGGIAERFCDTLDCVDVKFRPDGVLDELPQPSQTGGKRVARVDLNKPRLRAALTREGARAALGCAGNAAIGQLRQRPVVDVPVSRGGPARARARRRP